MYYSLNTFLILKIFGYPFGNVPLPANLLPQQGAKQIYRLLLAPGSKAEVEAPNGRISLNGLVAQLVYNQ